MKKKFIMTTMAVLLIVAMFAIFMVPASADAGPASDLAPAGTADLAVIASEAVMIEDLAPTPAPAASTLELTAWLVLGACLVITIVCRRRLNDFIKRMKISLGGLFHPASATDSGGADTKFI